MSQIAHRQRLRERQEAQSGLRPGFRPVQGVATFPGNPTRRSEQPQAPASPVDNDYHPPEETGQEDVQHDGAAVQVVDQTPTPETVVDASQQGQGGDPAAIMQDGTVQHSQPTPEGTPTGAQQPQVGDATVSQESQQVTEARATAEMLSQLDQAQYEQSLADLQGTQPELYAAVVDELNKMVSEQAEQEGDGFDLSDLTQGQPGEGQGADPSQPPQE